MVCKEDVLLWFKDLESYKRIDLLYELLNMCLPFELRFLGSCVEEIGKHTYQELRGPTLTANDLDKLSKDPTLGHRGLLEESVRHRALVFLSLLGSKNYGVAQWLYKNVLRTGCGGGDSGGSNNCGNTDSDWLDDYILNGHVKDDSLQSEFLLLFVMALYHPAFTFEQKLYFGRIVSHLVELREGNNHGKQCGAVMTSSASSSPRPGSEGGSGGGVFGYPPGFGYPAAKPSMNVVQLQEVPPSPVPVVKTSSVVNTTIVCGGDDDVVVPQYPHHLHHNHNNHNPHQQQQQHNQHSVPPPGLPPSGAAAVPAPPVQSQAQSQQQQQQQEFISWNRPFACGGPPEVGPSPTLRCLK